MADEQCVLLAQCKFFNDKLPNMPDYAELLKELYCLDDYGECARFLVYSRFGVESVPLDLFPNEIFKARTLINTLLKDTERP